MANFLDVEKILTENKSTQLTYYKVSHADNSAGRTGLELKFSPYILESKDSNKNELGLKIKALHLSLQYHLKLHSKLGHFFSLRAIFARNFLLKKFKAFEQEYVVLREDDVQTSNEEMNVILVRMHRMLTRVAEPRPDGFFAWLFGFFYGSALDDSSYVRAVALLYREEVGKLQRELDGKKADDFAKEKDQLAQANKLLGDRIAPLQTQLTQQKDEIETLKADIVLKDTAIIKLKESNQSLSATKQLLEGKNKTLTDKINSLGKFILKQYDYFIAVLGEAVTKSSGAKVFPNESPYQELGEFLKTKKAALEIEKKVKVKVKSGDVKSMVAPVAMPVDKVPVAAVVSNSEFPAAEGDGPQTSTTTAKLVVQGVASSTAQPVAQTSSSSSSTSSWTDAFGVLTGELQPTTSTSAQPTSQSRATKR